MFVSLMAYPKFYEKHMKIFIALSPVIYLENVNYMVAQKLKERKLTNQQLIEKFKTDDDPEMSSSRDSNFLLLDLFELFCHNPTFLKIGLEFHRHSRRGPIDAVENLVHALEGEGVELALLRVERRREVGRVVAHRHHDACPSPVLGYHRS